MKKKSAGLSIIAVLILLTFNYINNNYDISSLLEPSYSSLEKVNAPMKSYTLETIPEYSEEGYVILNDNIPDFTDEDRNQKEFEYYEELDELGRASLAIANIGVSLMPTEARGEIGMIKPSGWPKSNPKYDIIEGKYLFNRCHLIGYQLTGENANVNNLITCTRYMNTPIMLGFEDLVADYIKETNNHVLYRVTPIYEGDNLLASGVVMEAESLEDNGAGIRFNVYLFNNQPGIEINYKTSESKLKN